MNRKRRFFAFRTKTTENYCELRKMIQKTSEALKKHKYFMQGNYENHQKHKEASR